MITFKSTEDLSKLPENHPAHDTVKDLVDRLITEYTPPGQPYDHDAYGYVILIECPLLDYYSALAQFFKNIFYKNISISPLHPTVPGF